MKKDQLNKILKLLPSILSILGITPINFSIFEIDININELKDLFN